MLSNPAMSASVPFSLPFSDQIRAAGVVIETPAVLIDSARMAQNIAQMADLAAANRVALRPHAKTHKSLAIAERQLALGAAGITVAKPSEAEVFLRAGIASVTIACPILDRAKLERTVRTARDHDADVRFIADSDAGIDALVSVGAAHATHLPVLLKVDVGLHRCGVQPQSPRAAALARRLATTSGARLAGLLSHAGHAYRAGSAADIRQIAVAEREAMTGLAQLLRDAGIEVPEVSVGCTPTVVLHGGLDGITEIRPGNYVFMDRIQVALGVAEADEVALWVAATVISSNDRYAIIDAGSKVLSSDLGPHGSTGVRGYGLAWSVDEPGLSPLTVMNLSEEHGFLEHGGNPPKIGSRIVMMPNHACTVVNLADAVAAVAADGSLAMVAVEARGRVK